MWQSLKNELRRQQARLDEKIGTWLDGYAAEGGRKWCAKGCKNCCTLAVNCTFGEALLVAGALRQEQADALRAHVGRLRTHLGGASDLKSWLRLHRQVLGGCPFLEADGACGVYAARPFSCRALLSTRPADWCAVDFAELTPLDRQLFMASLDRDVVDFPTHYVAATRELAQEQEEQAVWEMQEHCGFTLSGNLPFLVWLEREYRLSETAAQGYAATRNLLEREGLNLPYVVSLSQGREIVEPARHGDATPQ